MNSYHAADCQSSHQTEIRHILMYTNDVLWWIPQISNQSINLSYYICISLYIYLCKLDSNPYNWWFCWLRPALHKVHLLISCLYLFMKIGSLFRCPSTCLDIRWYHSKHDLCSVNGLPNIKSIKCHILFHSGTKPDILPVNKIDSNYHIANVAFPTAACHLMITSWQGNAFLIILLVCWVTGGIPSYWAYDPFLLLTWTSCWTKSRVMWDTVTLIGRHCNVILELNYIYMLHVKSVTVCQLLKKTTLFMNDWSHSGCPIIYCQLFEYASHMGRLLVMNF